MDDKEIDEMQRVVALALSKIARELDQLAAEVTISGTGIGTDMMCRSIHYAADLLRADRIRILNGRNVGGRLML